MEFLEDYKLNDLIPLNSETENENEKELLSLLRNSKEFRNQYNIFASYMSEKELECYPIDKNFNPAKYEIFKGNIKCGKHGGIWKKDLDGNWRILNKDKQY